MTCIHQITYHGKIQLKETSAGDSLIGQKQVIIILKAAEKASRALGHHSFSFAYYMADTVNSLICQKAVKHANGTILAGRGVLAEMKLFVQVYYMPHFIVE